MSEKGFLQDMCHNLWEFAEMIFQTYLGQFLKLFMQVKSIFLYIPFLNIGNVTVNVTQFYLDP